MSGASLAQQRLAMEEARGVAEQLRALPPGNASLKEGAGEQGQSLDAYFSMHEPWEAAARRGRTEVFRSSPASQCRLSDVAEAGIAVVLPPLVADLLLKVAGIVWRLREGVADVEDASARDMWEQRVSWMHDEVIALAAERLDPEVSCSASPFATQRSPRACWRSDSPCVGRELLRAFSDSRQPLLALRSPAKGPSGTALWKCSTAPWGPSRPRRQRETGRCRKRRRRHLRWARRKSTRASCRGGSTRCKRSCGGHASGRRGAPPRRPQRTGRRARRRT